MHFNKRSLALTLILTLLLSVLPFAEGVDDPAPSLSPSGPANNKHVLFDNSHGQTAGAADWVIDGAFSAFGEALADRGYHVTELRKDTAITLSDLQNYDLFILPEANIPYKVSEQQAIVDYVTSGGSVFFISDHYNADRNKNRWDASEVFNGYRRGAYHNPTQGMLPEEAASAAMQNVVGSDWLADNFGVRFRYNAIGDVTANLVVDSQESFGITEGVHAVAVHAGSTLAILDPTKAKGIVYLPTTNRAWNYAVDQGVYNNGNVGEGPFVAIAKAGAGKAAFIGDSSPVEDASPKYLREENGGTKRTYDGFFEVDDAKLLVQLVDWLATPESYTRFSQVAGFTLDNATALYSWEQPINSTEPEAEPWSSPDVGYKWYDSSTFIAGSYGYQEDEDDDTPTPGNSSDAIFFSEYIEGSSYNKALELYNPTSESVDLSAYQIKQSNNSASISLAGTIAPHDSFVLAHNNANSTIKNKADQLTGQIYYNGDDKVDLVLNNSIIDSIGKKGVNFGKDKTLVRKPYVNAGRTVYDAAEWQTYSRNDASHLGEHSYNGVVNHAPVVEQALADLALTLGDSQSIDLANVFNDQDQDTLSFSASASAANIVTLNLQADVLTVSAQTTGQTTVTVVADDGHGATAESSFNVTVNQDTPSSSDELYFSEYIEGSSYNKALEIYNGTASPIDLSNYKIKQSNGSYFIQLQGTVQPGDVFVIAHSNAMSSIKNEADQLTGQIIYNGNDTVGLYNNGELIDLIGRTGSYFAKDKTLVRNNTVTEGRSQYDSNEWTVYSKNTTQYLGRH